MFKAIALLLLAAVCVVACGPQPLPFIPTPIPTLVPATLPAPGPTSVGGLGQGGMSPTPPPAAGSEPSVGAGVFEKNCSVCHNLTAETKVGPGLAGLFSRDRLPNGNPVTDDNLKAWIRSGSGAMAAGIAMPGIPLTDADLEAVVAFLKEATK